jgi:uncharacterized membrane protein
MRTLWSVLLIGVVATVGCKRESEKGGPGADANRAARTTDNRGAEESSAEDTFTVKVPESMKVPQGERKEVTVTLNRGNKFNQDVKITFKAPAGVKMEPSSATIKAGEKEHKFTVEAMSDAKVGEATVQVIGTPATGKAANVDLTVTVQKKS